MTRIKTVLLLCLLGYAGLAFPYYSYPNVSQKQTEYSCDGLKVLVSYEPGKAYLKVSHYTYVLSLVRSKVGTLYRNDIMSFFAGDSETELIIRSRRRSCQQLELAS